MTHGIRFGLYDVFCPCFPAKITSCDITLFLRELKIQIIIERSILDQKKRLFSGIKISITYLSVLTFPASEKIEQEKATKNNLR